MPPVLRVPTKSSPKLGASNESLLPSFSLLNVQNKPVELDFSGGLLTSDAGVLLLREVEEQIGLIKAMVEAIPDSRDEHYVKH
ncbi:MAG: transposase, partial [Candidatus Latescibacterota bacterium]